MLAKQRLTGQPFAMFAMLLVLLVLTNTITAQNQTLLNHQRSRNFNREGYRAYRVKNWNLALQKFSQSIELDPYYTYPVYNMACVLSLRGRPQDAYRIYQLLLEVLLQESGESRSIHQAKMQKDPDLAWFRHREPELFIMLNNVILDYNSQEIYRKLRRRRIWNLQTSSYRQTDIRPPQKELRNYAEELDDKAIFTQQPSSVRNNENSGKGGARDIGENHGGLGTGYVVPPEERKNSITVTPSDIDFEPNQLFGNPSDSTKGFSGYDQEERDIFFPFVPQSLRQQYRESHLTLNLVSQDSKVSGIKSLQENEISFEGYRYTWRFRAGQRLFEMQGFFVIRGNVLILETFASSPQELEKLPFDWEVYRSLFLIHQPQINEFQTITSTAEQVRIF